MSNQHQDELQWSRLKYDNYAIKYNNYAIIADALRVGNNKLYPEIRFIPELNWKEIAFKKRKYFDKEEDML